VRPNIVFLRETLVHAEKAHAFFHLLIPRCHCCVVNSVGKSGGLLVSWDPNSFDLVPYLTCGGMLLTSIDLESKRQISLLNIYGPCSVRKQLWERLEKSGLLALKNLVIASNLNLYPLIWRDLGRNKYFGHFDQFFY